ncbi:MAG TPA: hypothetical protein VGI78_10975 [Acetobacteraceae bacterium]
MTPVHPTGVEAEKHIIQHDFGLRQIDRSLQFLAIRQPREHRCLADRFAVPGQHQAVETIADREPPVPDRDHVQPDGRHQRLGPRTGPKPWQTRRQSRKILCLVCRKRRAECALGGLQYHHLPLMAFVHADATGQVHPDSYLASARQPMS